MLCYLVGSMVARETRETGKQGNTESGKQESGKVESGSMESVENGKHPAIVAVGLGAMGKFYKSDTSYNFYNSYLAG